MQVTMVCLQTILGLLFSFFVFLFILYKRVSNQSKSTRNIPPSPQKLPIIGNIHQLGTHPYRSLQSLSQQYGDLMLLHLGSRPTLIVSSASAAQEIMKTHDAVFSNRPNHLSVFGRLLYNRKDVAAAPYGEYWRQMRSLIVLQMLSHKRVQSFHRVRVEETVLMLEKIARSSPSSMNLSEMFVMLTNDVVCRVAFGRKYSGEGVGCTNFKQILKDFVELLGGFYVGDFIPWLAWIHRVNGLYAKVERVFKDFDYFIEGIVREHSSSCRDEVKNVEGNDKEEKVKDLVDVLLEVQKNNLAGFPIERDSIKALILDVFAAGTDTTYTVIEWAMSELLRHPHIMKELQIEVRKVVGSKVEILKDDLQKMTYLKAVIKETLRLHPPIPLLVPRKSTKDAKINGYNIACGTQVVVNSWAIHRDPSSWDEPKEFHPERFLDCTIDFKGQDFQFIPFGAGRRGCPGIAFAIVVNELVLANLMHKFDWALPIGVHCDTLDMNESIGLTAHRATPLLAVATPHSSSMY
ncbi:hypothetical protein Ancab_004345 [Ancistrocladus abbreviatus]